MAQMQRLRLVVANDPRSYRETIATALQRLRPDVQVMVVNPVDLGEKVELWHPHMVISNVPVASAEGFPICWVALYPASKTLVVVNLAGRQTSARDMGLAELLAIVDRAAALAGSMGLYSI